jgi:hypothetical protein
MSFNFDPPAATRHTVAKRSHTWLLWLVIFIQFLISTALVLNIASKKDAPPAPGPSPIVSEDVASINERAHRKYLKGSAEASEQIAKEIEEGKLVTSEQIFAKADAYHRAVLEDAFDEIAVLNNKYLREGEKSKLNVPAAIEFQKQKAIGTRRIK